MRTHGMCQHCEAIIDWRDAAWRSSDGEWQCADGQEHKPIGPSEW